MKILTIAIAIMCAGCASSQQPSELTKAPARKESPKYIPQLLRVKEFNSATLARAANHYISLGEARAIKELKLLEEDIVVSASRRFQRNERIGWVCRIIFQGPKDLPLRPPAYGGLSLPRLTMPLDRWPLYPVAESKGVHFVLSEGYTLAGVAERASDYVDYCSTKGAFRTTKLKVPSREDALHAFDALENSQRWKDLKWKDSGPGTRYTMSQQWVLEKIKAQATSIPDEANP